MLSPTSRYVSQHNMVHVIAMNDESLTGEVPLSRDRYTETQPRFSLSRVCLRAGSGKVLGSRSADGDPLRGNLTESHAGPSNIGTPRRCRVTCNDTLAVIKARLQARDGRWCRVFTASIK